MSTGKNTRKSVSERAKQFSDLVGRIDYAAIQKQDPQVQMMILQQKQQELMQAQSENQAYTAGLQQQLDQGQQQLDQGIEGGLSQKELDEIKTEVEYALRAGQQLSHQIKSVQEAQMAAQNAASQEHSYRNRSTPKPGMG